MNKYTINFVFDGLIDIEAKTKKEAFKKYNNLTWVEVVQNSRDISEETEIVEVIKEPIKEDKPLSTLEKFILDWLGYEETDDEWKRDTIIKALSELNNQELVALNQDIIEYF